MDPIAAINLANDSEGPERLEALESLADWIAKGGFIPEPCPELQSHDSDAEEGTDRLVSALRVACSYGDRSGLDGLGWRVAR